MIQSQTNFSGGINTFFPRHQIPDSFSQDIVDGEVFDGSIQNTKGFGNLGGGASFFYEAGSSWVGTSGFADNTVTDHLVLDRTNESSNSHVDNNNFAQFNSPAKIGRGLIYTIESGHTIQILTAIKGLFNANSFVEYNRDLYVGRNEYTVDIDLDSNNNPRVLSHADGTQIYLKAGSIQKVHVGDQLVVSDLIPNFTQIIQINYDFDNIIINKEITANQGQTALAIDATPIRVIEGDLNTTFQLGLPIPEPVFQLEQIGNNNLRSLSHTSIWYSTPSGYYPIPYQYGLSEYDLPTGAESAISELTDPSTSAVAYKKSSSNTSLPVRVEISNVSQGQYALYRTGGTSAIQKKVATLLLGYNTTLTATFNNAQITITASSIPPGRYRLKLYPYNGNEYDYVSELIEDTNNSGSVTFTFNESNSLTAHHLDILLECELLADSFSRIGVLNAMTIENSVVTSGNVGDSYSFLDFVPPQSLIDIQPITSSSMPPFNMKFLIEVNNFFFGAVGRTLYISGYADPNNWPLDGYIVFENEITALAKRGSDLLVFTPFNLFRVFGSTADSMRKVKIPTVEGVPIGLDKCVKELGQGVIYLSPNGLQFFNGAEVQNLTKDIIPFFEKPNIINERNIAGVFDNRYYLLTDTEDGYIIDFRKGLRVTRTTLNSTNLHYRGIVNRLYNQDGALGDGSVIPYEVVTRSFDGNDRTRLKIFKSFNLVAENLEPGGTIEFYVDQQLVQSFSTPSVSTATVGRAYRLNEAYVGLEAHIKFVNVVGRVIRLDVEMEDLAEQFLRRWESIDVQFSGTVSLNFSVDGVPIIQNYVLTTSVDEPKTAQIFLPAMTEGEIGHIYCDEDEENKILRISYGAEAI
jgi:hypothetical protein